MINKVFFIFSRKTRKLPQLIKTKEVIKSQSNIDEKAAKISVHDDTPEQLQFIQDLQKKYTQPIKLFLKEYEQRLTKEEYEEQYIQKYKQIHKILPTSIPPYVEPQIKEAESYQLNSQEQNHKRVSHKVDPLYGNVHNTEKQLKLQSQIQQLEYQGQQNYIRTGVLSKKIGMMSQWDIWGKHIPLTVLQMDRVQVVQQVKNGKYTGLQIGAGIDNIKKVKKPQLGHYIKNDLHVNKVLCQFQVHQDLFLPVGYILSPRHFTPGQYVDIQGYSKGKGFQGAMQRWNFKGQPASHGVSISHRSLGSTGKRQNASRVFKNKKMHGRGGNELCTLQNKKVYKVDHERGLIYIIGGVQGTMDCWVKVKDSIKKREKNFKKLNYPTTLNAESNVIVMEPPMEDPMEKSMHENDIVEDKKQEADV